MKLTSIISTLLLLTAASATQAETGNTAEMQFSETSGAQSSGILMNAKADIQVSGLTAKVTLTQTWQNPSSSWVAGKYLLPLPKTAAIDSLKIKTEDALIAGEIKEKQEAKKVYEAAKTAGKKAALIEAIRPNLFSTKVANIAPNSEVQVVISYLQPVDFKQDVFSLMLPNTLTRRYIPRRHTADEGSMDAVMNLTAGGFNSLDVSAPQIEKQPATHNIEIHAELDPGFEVETIESDHHGISWLKQGDHYEVSLKAGTVAMDQDFVLRWKATPENTPNAAVFSEQLDSDSYINLMLMPPQQNLNNKTLPRETIFVIDSSGSMQGPSMAQAKKALRKALSLLTPTDTFNIIDFDDKFKKLFSQAEYATADQLSKADAFIDAMHADGGTEIRGALEAALGETAVEGQLKQVIFLTDGAVGNESEILVSIKQQLGNNRIFTIGIGHAPNSYFMRKAAEYGRGSYTYINEVNQVEERVGKLFEQIKNPLLKDIELTFSGGAKPEMYPASVPDLYLGQPINVFIKTPGNAEHTIQVIGRLLDQPWQRSVTFTAGQDSVGVAKHWANKKIDHLMDMEILGEPVEKIKAEVTDTALKFGLASKYTSFVAVEKTSSRPENATLENQAVPNLLPKGATAYPKTATTAQLQAMIALALFVLGLLLVRNNEGARHNA